MKSCSRLFRFLGLGLALLATTTMRAEDAKSAPLAADDPAQLKPVAVSTVFVSIRLRPYYRDSATGPRVSRLMIEEVRTKSLAERAGLLAGMELLAIQGTLVSGLRDVDLEKLCDAPVNGDTLVLKIAEPPKISGSIVIPREIRVPLTKPAADKSKDLTNTIEPKKRRPSGDQK